MRVSKWQRQLALVLLWLSSFLSPGHDGVAHEIIYALVVSGVIRVEGLWLSVELTILFGTPFGSS